MSTITLNTEYGITAYNYNANVVNINCNGQNQQSIYLNENCSWFAARCNNWKYNLSEFPFNASLVTNAHDMFLNCYNISGNALITPNAVDCAEMYNCAPPPISSTRTCGNLNQGYIPPANQLNAFAMYMGQNKMTNAGNFTSDQILNNVQYMFVNCTNLKTIPSNLENTYVGNNCSFTSMFYNCYNLTGSPVFPKTYENSRVTNMALAYYNCANLTGSPAAWPNCTYNVFGLAQFRNIYTYCSKLTGNAVFTKPNSTYSSYNFLYGNCYAGCTNLTGITNLPYYACEIENLFQNCYKIKYTLNGDEFSSLNNINIMAGIFYNCSNINGNPFCCQNKYNINMGAAFYNCRNLTGPPKIAAYANNINNTYCHCCNLTGSPVMPDTITTIYADNTYNNCRSLNGSPVCSNKIKYMCNTYRNCVNLTGKAIFGDKVLVANNTYDNCYNLTSYEWGPNIQICPNTFTHCNNLRGTITWPNNLSLTNEYAIIGTFQYCTNLTGSPVVPDGAKKMGQTFQGCTGLTGSPVIPDSVVSAQAAYAACTGLTGSPVLGANLYWCYSLYSGCTGLTGSPIMTDTVNECYAMYSGCTGLTGSPVAPTAVCKNMTYMYYNCTGLTGNPVCGTQVNYIMNCYENCYNLNGTQSIVEANVTNMAFCYSNCNNLSGNIFIKSNNLKNNNCFTNFIRGHNSTMRINIYIYGGTVTDNAFTNNTNSWLKNKGYDYIGAGTMTVSGNLMYNTTNNVYLYNNWNGVIW